MPGNRLSTRLPNYDYRFGRFFFTLVTYERKPRFGKIVNGEMILSEEGKIVAEQWLKTPIIRNEIQLDDWTVMPEHFHAIVFIDNRNVGGACWRPWPSNKMEHMQEIKPIQEMKHIQEKKTIHNNTMRIKSIQPANHSLARMINQFKATTTRRINQLLNIHSQPVWQRGYDDRIIRNTVQLDKFRHYIRDNPRNYEKFC